MSKIFNHSITFMVERERVYKDVKDVIINYEYSRNIQLAVVRR